MCGIAGIYSRRRPVSEDALIAMTDCLSHRGPDDRGFFLNSKIGLGHRRLSIIDLNLGHQPIFNEDESVCAVFNGEIYNFEPLRTKLIAQGHHFKTHCDTEVLVHLYEEEGLGLTHELNGMYAFALWDQKRQRLMLARDPLGMKPLFYHELEGQLIFGSEIKSLRRYPGFNDRINLESLHHYLSLMWIPTPLTIYEKVYKLPPGHRLTIGANQRLQIERFWEPNAHQETFARMSEMDITDLFEERFKNAVKTHLMSDVPFGAFLSGGLDSSAVVAYMQKYLDRPVKTFAIGFDGPKYFDELPYARRVADYLKTNHHEFIVCPQPRELLPQVTALYDEPFAVSSAIPTYLLAKYARRHVKMVLTGDGGDELLAGYTARYRADSFAQLLRRLIPTSLLRPCANLLSRPWPVPSMTPGANFLNKSLKFCSALGLESNHHYASYLSKLDEKAKQRLYAPALRQALQGVSTLTLLSGHFNNQSAPDLLANRLIGDMTSSLVDEMLTKVDRATMGVGLEARIPFLDRYLVETVLNIPSRMKLRGKESKYILRKALASQLPQDVLRRPKHGFEVPVDNWMRSSLREYLEDLLSPSHLNGHAYFDNREIQRYVTEELNGTYDHGHRLWILLAFQTWYDYVYKNKP